MARPKILVADDDPLILRAVVRELRSVGDVVEAGSGDEALTLLDQHDDLDAIVSDLEMPGLDGDQLLTAVCERYPACIRILLSGASNDRLAEVTSAQYIIRKPWISGEVSRLVARVAGNGHGA